MYLAGVNESLDFDHFGTLQLDLLEILRRYDYELLWLELIAFDNLLGRQGFATFLAFFLVTNEPVIVLMQLVEPDGFFRVNRVVDADGNGNQGKPDMAFPDRTHNSPYGIVVLSTRVSFRTTVRA